MSQKAHIHPSSPGYLPPLVSHLFLLSLQNALDAAESVSTLPTIGIEIKEMNQAEFNAYRGVLGSNERKDGSLFGLKEKKSKKRKLEDGEGAGGDEEEGTTAAEPVKEEKVRARHKAYYNIEH